MHRPAFAKLILALCTVLAALPLQACSPEEDPGFEDGTWASVHRTEIELDCDRRYVCAMRTNDLLTENAYESCLAQQAMKLNPSPDEQFNFVLSLRRCPGTDPCHYVNCADSGFLSYGQQQKDKLEYTCAQKVQCAIDTNTLANDATLAYQECVLSSVITLDGFPNESRTHFQETFFPCMPMTSCAFTACFGY